ncbi:MAG: Gfo/Idh/MocA family oxidoreductase [Anaerolineae bacterium]|nr:Gfo/Idh/MocA family oxidoreductase [Anaerolineae bacterium]
MSDRPRVGIVGAGRVGVDWHLPDIRAAGGEVIALADMVPGRASRFAAQHGISYAFDRYPDLLALPEVEVVAVCTPPHAHAEIAIAAVEAGKHLYLEKPPAMDESEMARIVQAVRRAGVLAMTGPNHIYESEVQALKRHIDAGTLGHVYLVECLKRLRRGLPKGMHVLAYRHFFECIRERRETQRPPERSVVVMRILDAIYRSAASGSQRVRQS